MSSIHYSYLDFRMKLLWCQKHISPHRHYIMNRHSRKNKIYFLFNYEPATEYILK